MSACGAGTGWGGSSGGFGERTLRPLFFNTALFNGLVLAIDALLAVLMLGHLGFTPCAIWPVGLAFLGPGAGGLLLVMGVELGLIFCCGVFDPVYATYRLAHRERPGRPHAVRLVGDDQGLDRAPDGRMGDAGRFTRPAHGHRPGRRAPAGDPAAAHPDRARPSVDAFSLGGRGVGGVEALERTWTVVRLRRSAEVADAKLVHELLDERRTLIAHE